MFDKRRHEEGHNRTSSFIKAMKARDGMHVSTLGLDDSKAGGRPAALEGLKIITLPELELDKVHCGTVLYGRLSAKAFQMSAIHTVLEDEFGKGVHLCIYNAMSRPEEIEALFPMGMKVAIKELYIKMALDGGTDVRVDDPGDVVHIRNHEDNDPEPKREEARVPEFLQAIRCKGKLGNKLFNKEEWAGAIFQYSLRIDATVVEGETLEDMLENFKDMIKLAYSNRAEARLRLTEFVGALSYAEQALELDPTHLKSLSRQGRATMEVGLYEKACKAFEAVLEACPDEPLARQRLTLCRGRLVQAHAGN